MRIGLQAPDLIATKDRESILNHFKKMPSAMFSKQATQVSKDNLENNNIKNAQLGLDDDSLDSEVLDQVSFKFVCIKAVI